MRNKLFVICVGVAVLGTVVAYTQQPEQIESQRKRNPPPTFREPPNHDAAKGQQAKEPPVVNAVKEFMRAKLTHSQKVLEGLALEDFDLIAKNSQAMSLLSKDSTWQVLQTSEYLRQSQDFQRVADELSDAAKKKSLDGAALAYVELTMKCVNCHKYVRTQDHGSH
jgi:cytochrome c556